MKLFTAYLRQQTKSILVFFLFSGIFALSFALYRLPAAAAGYPALLCLLFGALILALDSSRVRRRHREMERIRSYACAMILELPGAESIQEADYQALLEQLRQQAAAREREDEARFQNMVEYYTLWAHQIKTPITSMRLTLEREDSAFSRAVSSDLFQIEQYVEMVLAFLRLDSDSSDYVFREYSLDQILGGCLAKFASQFIARRIRLDYAPLNLSVVTDDKWLSFVIEQVLSNALKYTPEGSIRIYLEKPRTLCIEDTGIGIAPADLPRVFEKGYTGCNGREDKRASGIGLYLCRRICGKLGARIDLSSRPGEGTTVRIHLDQYDLKKE